MRAGPQRRERAREAVHADADEPRLDGSEAALPGAPEEDRRRERQKNEKSPSGRAPRDVEAPAEELLEDAALRDRRIPARILLGVGLRSVVGVEAFHVGLLACVQGHSSPGVVPQFGESGVESGGRPLSTLRSQLFLKRRSKAALASSGLSMARVPSRSKDFTGA